MNSVVYEGEEWTEYIYTAVVSSRYLRIETCDYGAFHSAQSNQ